MINATYGKDLIDAMHKGESINFPKPFIGLLSALPTNNGAGGGEVAYPEYHRIELNSLGIMAKSLMTDADDEEIVEDDIAKTVSSSENQEIIFFPENQTGETVVAVGVGFYAARTGGNPYFWVKFDEPVEIGNKTVPIFRKKMFKLLVK